jgi:hypothetical protein
MKTAISFKKVRAVLFTIAIVAATNFAISSPVQVSKVAKKSQMVISEASKIASTSPVPTSDAPRPTNALSKATDVASTSPVPTSDAPRPTIF